MLSLRSVLTDCASYSTWHVAMCGLLLLIISAMKYVMVAGISDDPNVKMVAYATVLNGVVSAILAKVECGLKKRTLMHLKNHLQSTESAKGDTALSYNTPDVAINDATGVVVSMLIGGIRLALPFGKLVAIALYNGVQGIGVVVVLAVLVYTGTMFLIRFKDKEAAVGVENMRSKTKAGRIHEKAASCYINGGDPVARIVESLIPIGVRNADISSEKDCIYELLCTFAILGILVVHCMTGVSLAVSLHMLDHAWGFYHDLGRIFTTAASWEKLLVEEKELTPRPDQAEVIDRVENLPYGVTRIHGESGWGKSTALLSGLQGMRKRGRAIRYFKPPATVEDFRDPYHVGTRTDDATLERFGLDVGVLERANGSFSTGQITKICMAWVVGNPLGGVTYALDEPLTGLDSMSVVRVKSQIPQDQRLVLISHNVSFED